MQPLRCSVNLWSCDYSQWLGVLGQTGFTAYAPVPASAGGPGVETAANEVTVTVR